ncbi:MAG: DUF3526 domain-containing protein [Pseudomonadota bacterium]
MIAAIAQNEFRGFLRNGVFISLAAAMLALMIGAAALSAQRLATFERERAAAEAVDHEVWIGQGARNPHSAAHFARYAFKPVPRLAAFDPGVTDYAGLALWMEAHYQNPAVFRRAEDLGDAGRFADLSPAWILQYAAPLFLFLVLFSSIAGEREQGTLRQMSASGLSARSLLAGKLAGAGLGVAAIIAPALILSLLAAGAGGIRTLPDVSVRTIGLAAAYVAYFVAIGGVAIGVSALAKEKRTALTALVAIWAGAFVLLPRLAASVAVTLHPTPEGATLSKALKEASEAYYVSDELKEQLKADTLAEHGVDKVDDLPFNYRGYALQWSEEYSHPLFEAFYDTLDATAARQEGVIAAASVFSPALAIDVLSAGLSGTDRHHHDAFRSAAEIHRRQTVKQLNDDLTYNAKERRYTNDETLWREIDDFSHTPPRFSELAGRYVPSALILFVYAAGGLAFAGFALNRAQKEIAQ